MSRPVPICICAAGKLKLLDQLPTTRTLTTAERNPGLFVDMPEVPGSAESFSPSASAPPPPSPTVTVVRSAERYDEPAPYAGDERSDDDDGEEEPDSGSELERSYSFDGGGDSLGELGADPYERKEANFDGIRVVSASANDHYGAYGGDDVDDAGTSAIYGAVDDGPKVCVRVRQAIPAGCCDQSTLQLMACALPSPHERIQRRSSFPHPRATHAS